MLTKNKLFLIWLFGAISGFTLMISGNTLNFWLAKQQIDIKTIGVFSLILTPYAFNFIWAPIFDTKRIYWLDNILGHRLSWICLIQVVLAFFVFVLSCLNPNQNIYFFALIGFVISFLSSAADTVLGALKTEIIVKKSQGAASGIYIFGYRIGTLLSSSGAIYLSSIINWNQIYLIFALIILFFPIILILNIKNINQIKEEQILSSTKSYKWYEIFQFINATLKPIGNWSFIILVIIFLVLYRLPDNFINTMINPFLIHLNFNELEIASVGKFFGITGAIIGGFIASSIMKRKDVISSLLIFGVIHAVAHSLFIVQEFYGKNILLLFIVNGFESITGGMTMAAYIAFIASLCQGRFRATQYSFFSAMMGLSRSIFPAISGYIVSKFGWQSFFAFVTIATIPSLLLVSKLAIILRNPRSYFGQKLEKL